MPSYLRSILAIVALLLLSGQRLVAQEQPATPRSILVRALRSEDLEEQERLLQSLIGAADPALPSLLVAWRGGSVFLHDPDSARIPFTLDSQTDSEGRTRGLAVANGAPLLDTNSLPVLFTPSELTPVDTSSRLRKAIKTVLDLAALGDPNAKTRRDAVIKLGQEQSADYLKHFEARLKAEKDPEVHQSIEEAIAITLLASNISETRVAASATLSRLRSINGLSFLQRLDRDARADQEKYGTETAKATGAAIRIIETYVAWGTFFGTTFRGLSLAAVILVAALGLAITFGLMGVINMAHGELIMVGAYTAYVTQNVFAGAFGPSGIGFELYFLAALVFSFVSAGCVGLILERGIIRFLYRRPLESLLATWGVSLVLQQVFRHIFGAANVQVSSPAWLSGSFVIYDVLLAYNRLFVIAFAIAIVFGTFLILTRTSLGLQVRAVMQNRAMAAALGVRTDHVNMMTFAFGSGLAGMAGACLSQIGNVGPSLGQNHIFDCFLVVVLGGVGSLVGSVWAALGIGVTDQILQPWLGAVMGKITVLAAIILFLQWRPAGLFSTRSRSLEG